MPRLLLLAVALLASAAFGCGFFNPEPTRVPSTPVPTLPPGAEVEEVDIANFQLADLEVKVGSVVIWTNRDRTLHTLTHVSDEGGSALFNSGTIYRVRGSDGTSLSPECSSISVSSIQST